MRAPWWLMGLGAWPCAALDGYALGTLHLFIPHHGDPHLMAALMGGLVVVAVSGACAIGCLESAWRQARGA
jgi:hypothetical protein